MRRHGVTLLPREEEEEKEEEPIPIRYANSWGNRFAQPGIPQVLQHWRKPAKIWHHIIGCAAQWKGAIGGKKEMHHTGTYIQSRDGPGIPCFSRSFLHSHFGFFAYAVWTPSFRSGGWKHIQILGVVKN